MASMFLRLVKGNATNPDILDDGISIHSFLGAMQAWDRGEVTRAEVVAAFSFTVADETDLDLIKSWYNASTDKKLFERVLKDRLYMAEDKTGGTNGYFDYAVKNTFLNGANGTTPLDGSF